MRKWLRLKVSFESHPPAQAGPPTASCPGLHPNGFWICPRREITTSLGNLCLCSVILIVRKAFLVSRLWFLCLRLCSLSLVLSLNTVEKSLDESFFSFSLQVFAYIYSTFPEPALWDQQSQLSQLFPTSEQFQALNHLSALPWILSSLSRSLLPWEIQKRTQHFKHGQIKGNDPLSA